MDLHFRWTNSGTHRKRHAMDSWYFSKCGWNESEGNVCLVAQHWSKQGRTAMLAPDETSGSYYIQIVTRLYRENRLTRQPRAEEYSRLYMIRAFSGSLDFTDSTVIGQFVASVDFPSSTTTNTTKITTKTTKTTTKTTSKTALKKTTTKTKTKSSAKTTTTNRNTTLRKTTITPKQFIAETCQVGKKYNNYKNCCCKPKKQVRNVFGQHLCPPCSRGVIGPCCINYNYRNFIGIYRLPLHSFTMTVFTGTTADGQIVQLTVKSTIICTSLSIFEV